MASKRLGRGGIGSDGGHDGAGMMRWLLTYADMITLLTAFFIMMYSMSVLNLEKFKRVAVSVRSGFGGEEGAAGIVEKGGVIYAQADEANVPNTGPTLKAILRYLRHYIDRHELREVMKCRLSERGLVISLTSDGMLFEKGRADVCPAAQVILDDVSVLLNRIENDILVEGHTCDLPISTATYPSNWELSTARAIAVVRWLIERDRVSAQRVGAAGYADTRPYMPNTCERDRRLNRRVDLVILSGTASVISNAQTAPETPPPYSRGRKQAAAISPQAMEQLYGGEQAQQEQESSAAKGLPRRGGPLGSAPRAIAEAGKALGGGAGVGKVVVKVREITKPKAH